MDMESCQWLADLIQQTTEHLSQNPGMTIEVEGQPEHWLQVLPEQDEQPEELSGYLLNFAYRQQSGDPAEAIAQAGIRPPTGVETMTWEDGGFATLKLNANTPLIDIAVFIREILTHIIGAEEGCEIGVKIEYGY